MTSDIPKEQMKLLLAEAREQNALIRVSLVQDENRVLEAIGRVDAVQPAPAGAPENALWVTLRKHGGQYVSLLTEGNGWRRQFEWLRPAIVDRASCHTCHELVEKPDRVWAVYRPGGAPLRWTFYAYECRQHITAAQVPVE